MSIVFNSTAQNRIENTASPVTTYPISLGFWLRPTTTSQYWKLSDGSANNYFSVRSTLTTNIAVAARASAGSTITLALTVPTLTNTWGFLLVRFISAALRRASFLHQDGTMVHGAETTSVTPLGLTTMGWGSFAGIAHGDASIAEAFYTNTDIVPDNGITPNTLLHQLAFRGPFSMPQIRKDIIEYRSFLSHPTHDKFNQVYYGKYGRQAWTNTSNATIGPQPPSAVGYAVPYPSDNNVFAYQDTPITPAERIGTSAGVATVLGVSTFEDSSTPVPGTGSQGGFLVNTGSMMNQ